MSLSPNSRLSGLEGLSESDLSLVLEEGAIAKVATGPTWAIELPDIACCGNCDDACDDGCKSCIDTCSCDDGCDDGCAKLPSPSPVRSELELF